MDELNVKIAINPEEAFWKQLEEKCVKDIATHEREIIINKAIIDLAKQKIDEVK